MNDVYDYVSKGLVDWNDILTSESTKSSQNIKSPTLAALESGRVPIANSLAPSVEFSSRNSPVSPSLAALTKNSISSIKDLYSAETKKSGTKRTESKEDLDVCKGRKITGSFLKETNQPLPKTEPEDLQVCKGRKMTGSFLQKSNTPKFTTEEDDLIKLTGFRVTF